MKLSGYRAEIDGLPAIAIIPVVLYTVFPKIFVVGYLGVDVFFVISGFLITKIIYNEIKNGDFEFHRVFGRRVRRLFPALICALIASSLFGYIFLIP